MLIISFNFLKTWLLWYGEQGFLLISETIPHFLVLTRANDPRVAKVYEKLNSWSHKSSMWDRLRSHQLYAGSSCHNVPWVCRKSKFVFRHVSFKGNDFFNHVNDRHFDLTRNIDIEWTAIWCSHLQVVID